ncbi:HD domain-containing protein [Streptococcus loxodontisalivarius]|nr:HD domain-containing protein [Streptococcus loxodontisalivarius]
MTENQQLEAIEHHVKKALLSESSGHDWWHIHRVRNAALKIAAAEGANSFICQSAALLHDMIDDKLFDNPEAEKIKLQAFLEEIEVSKDDSDWILAIIDSISFKAGQGGVPETLEGQIVQDADRLDAIGAIGIARTMAYSGNKGRLIHDPEMQARDHLTLEEYRSGQDTAIMHFYEKLLKLKDLMNTSYAQKLAQDRHDYMLGFLEQFYAEWEGDK